MRRRWEGGDGRGEMGNKKGFWGAEPHKSAYARFWVLSYDMSGFLDLSEFGVSMMGKLRHFRPSGMGAWLLDRSGMVMIRCEDKSCELASTTTNIQMYAAGKYCGIGTEEI